MAAKKRSRPRVTQRVIEGIIAASSAILAGSPAESLGGTDDDPDLERDWEDIQAADNWARGMREWMRSRGTWKERPERE